MFYNVDKIEYQCLLSKYERENKSELSTERTKDGLDFYQGHPQRNPGQLQGAVRDPRNHDETGDSRDDAGGLGGISDPRSRTSETTSQVTVFQGISEISIRQSLVPRLRRRWKRLSPR